MKILFYLLSLRWGHFLDKPKKILPLALKALLLLVLFANAAVFAMLLNYLAKQPRGAEIAPLVARLPVIVSFIPVVVFFIPVILLFIPSYSPKANLFTPYDPISRLPKVTIEIFYHFLSSRYVIVIACLLCLFGIATPFHLSHLFQSLIVLFASGIACLIVQTLLDPELFVPARAPMAALFLLSSGYLLLLTGSIARVGAGMILCYWMLAYGLQFVSRRPEVSRFKPGSTSGNFFTILISACFKTGSLRINLIIAVLFKTVFLLLFIKSTRNKHVPLPIYLEYFLFSSLILFTYVFNNVWGYLKTTYLNLAQQRDSLVLFKAYLFLLAFPVAIDILLSLGFAIGGRLSPAPFAGFYLLSLPANILIGFYASLKRPFEVAKAIDLVRFRSNTSIGFSLLSMLSTCLCGFLILTSPTYPLLLLAAAVYLALLVRLYYLLIVRRKIEIYIEFPYHLFTPKS
jgi:hypothetical protein